MTAEINPKDTDREQAFRLWMHAPNPMITLIKTFDVTPLVRFSQKHHLKFNMLMNYCIGKAAVSVKEFFILPVGEKLIQYDCLAVNCIVKNCKNGINSCDIRFSDDLKIFNRRYLRSTAHCSQTCTDADLSASCMVIGTSAVTETELDGAVSLYTGVFNNPFLIWGKYRKTLCRYRLPVSFQFHHTQMDGAHAGRFLANLQTEINQFK